MRSDPAPVSATPSCFLEEERERPETAESKPVRVCVMGVGVRVRGFPSFSVT